MIRRLLGALLGLLLLAAIPVFVLAVILSRLDPNDYAPSLIAAVSTATGRIFALGAPLQISWSFHPTITATRVTLSNIAGGSRADIARVERIDAKLSLLPLLHHRLEILSLTLTGPNVLLEQVGATPNWVFVADTAGTSRYALRIRHVVVVNGMVTFHFPARTKVIGLRHLDFQRPVEAGPLDLAATLVYSDFKPATLHAHAIPTGDDAAPWSTKLDFSAFDATASAHGSMSLAGPYELQIDARAPALEALNALLPEMNLPALHRMTVSTHIMNGPDRGDLPVIGATTLHVGSADLSDRIPGLTLGTLDLSLPAPGGLARLTAAARYQAWPFTLSGTVGIPKYPDKPSTIPLDLTAASSQATASLNGRAALRNLAFDGLSGTLAVNAAALTALDPSLPALTKLSAHAALTVPKAASSFRLQNASLRSAQIDATGNLAIDPDRALTTTVHASRLDLDSLLPTTGMAASTSTDALFPTTPLPWARLQGPALDVTADIATLTFAKRVWHDLSLTAHLHGGHLQIDRLHAALPGGSPLDGTMDINAGHPPAHVTLKLEAPAVPLSFVLEAAGLPGQAEGNLVLDTQLDATGGSPHDLAATLGGSISMTAVGGTLSNATLINVAAAPLKQLRITVPTDGRTSIHCVGLIGSFENGIGRFPTITFETGTLRIAGAGTVDLGAETLALKLHPLARVAGSSVQVAVVVDGSLLHPQPHTDISTLDKIGLAIDGLFGGDHPHTCAKAGLVPKSSIAHDSRAKASGPGRK